MESLQGENWWISFKYFFFQPNIRPLHHGILADKEKTDASKVQTWPFKFFSVEIASYLMLDKPNTGGLETACSSSTSRDGANRDSPSCSQRRRNGQNPRPCKSSTSSNNQFLLFFFLFFFPKTGIGFLLTPISQSIAGPKGSKDAEARFPPSRVRAVELFLDFLCILHFLFMFLYMGLFGWGEMEMGWTRHLFFPHRNELGLLLCLVEELGWQKLERNSVILIFYCY